MAGGVADRKKYRLVLLLRLVKGLGSPGQPVHRIFTVLAQIRGAFIYQTVAHATASTNNLYYIVNIIYD
jgi:hypothetical protein